MPTLLRKLLRRPGGLVNQGVHRFEKEHSGAIGESEIAVPQASDALFARKFPDDAAAPVRVQVIAELMGIDRAVTEAATAATAESEST